MGGRRRTQRRCRQTGSSPPLGTPSASSSLRTSPTRRDTPASKLTTAPWVRTGEGRVGNIISHQFFLILWGRGQHLVRNGPSFCSSVQTWTSAPSRVERRLSATISATTTSEGSTAPVATVTCCTPTTAPAEVSLQTSGLQSLRSPCQHDSTSTVFHCRQMRSRLAPLVDSDHVTS